MFNSLEMVYSYGITLLILCPLIFLAAFIDSIAGGGGLISLPAYLFVGLPIHTAYGTNKFSASMGGLTAMVNYIRGGYVDFHAAISGGICAFFGSLIGTYLALSLSPYALQVSLMIILPLAGIFIFTRHSLMKILPNTAFFRNKPDTMELRVKLLVCSLIGLIFGCYDGFFGPGTGMFITMGLSAIVGLDLIKSAGSARVINFSSNIASTVTWIINGRVLFPIAIPCMLCAVSGAFLGSKMAMKAGRKFISPILALVAILLFTKILIDLINL